MKKLISIFGICAGLTIMAAPVFAQAPTPSPAPAAPAGCTEEAKAALYTEFTTFRTTNATKAYEAGRKYLACSQGEDQYTAYIRKWVTAYEKEARKLKLTPLLYNEKKYAEAMALGKEILAEEPENLKVIIDLGYLGYLATITAKNESFNNDSLGFARKAIQMIESGKAPENWSPFKSKDDALAYLYNAIGRLTLKSNSPETLTALIKAAQFESEVKKDPWIYFFVAAAYEAGPYSKLSAEYKACCEGKDETPQSKLTLANIQQVVDRMVDAYARAVALAGNDPKFQASKTGWMESLTTWYKFRHNDSDAGLTEMIAGVLAKPLPPEPTPLTTLPATTPASTTPTSGAVNTGGEAVGTPAAAPATTNPTTTNPTPAKPKPRNNHRRRN